MTFILRYSKVKWSTPDSLRPTTTDQCPIVVTWHNYSLMGCILEHRLLLHCSHHHMHQACIAFLSKLPSFSKQFVFCLNSFKFPCYMFNANVLLHCMFCHRKTEEESHISPLQPEQPLVYLKDPFARRTPLPFFLYLFSIKPTDVLVYIKVMHSQSFHASLQHSR